MTAQLCPSPGKLPLPDSKPQSVMHLDSLQPSIGDPCDSAHQPDLTAEGVLSEVWRGWQGYSRQLWRRVRDGIHRSNT